MKSKETKPKKSINVKAHANKLARALAAGILVVTAADGIRQRLESLQVTETGTMIVTITCVLGLVYIFSLKIEE